MGKSDVSISIKCSLNNSSAACEKNNATQEELEEIVANTRRSEKRLESLTVAGHRVYGAVATRSGIPESSFELATV